MKRVAVTGATGFIGQAVVRACLARGYEVLALSRRPSEQGIWIKWSLGDPIPEECNSVDAVVHLASATLIAKDHIDESVRLDISGTHTLAETAKALRPDVRFIFLSSQSASPSAQNRYGQSKYAIEQSLTGKTEIVVRPGLVFDDEGASVFGLFKKLSKLPVIPVISKTANIHPIHVDELANCLMQIIETSEPAKLYCLGSPVPLTFADAISETARRYGGRPPIGIPVPLFPVKSAAWIVDKTLRISPSLCERIDGLIALNPMETGPSIHALGIPIAGLGFAQQG